MDESIWEDMDVDQDEDEEDFTIDVVVDPVSGRVVSLCTIGLNDQGLPELAIQPPHWFEPPGGTTWFEFGNYLADMLSGMGDVLIEDDEFIALVTDFKGAETIFRCTGGPPSGPASRYLSEHIDEAFEVTCSLWGDPDLSVIE